ncbi:MULTISPECIES: Wadjet anti-phage system protein JetD domain-containing protein [unclassified Micromonospora]|uniref:Wadjet anti-phage system protein JetD domain-containing protein n=1 Tax=unclassified Micromonospora TaxID=2617518 RepID=UPI0022B6598A|nr:MULTISPECIES: Wadjet anti-phage system protein JetD domain-containing protein [unclassified Micromonospora]MCZ7420700.1 DUF2220 family protein [Verrucosispora sp. WMMA2121]WBB88849.1 DUF2220 family protein [Verrucosispora sp. WMMC514]
MTVPATRWSTPADLVAKLRRRWNSGELLTAYARQRWEPIVVPLRAPTAVELGENFGAAQDWLAAWQAVDPTLVRLEWKRVGGRLVGSNEVPHRAVIDSADRMWSLLRVKRQVETFLRLVEATRSSVPGLVEWMIAEPMKVLDHEPSWPRLVDVVRWIDRHPSSERYVRQIDVPGVDTKFIEQHRGVLAQLLDRQLAPERVDPAQPPGRFAERYRFRTKPAYVRLRALTRPAPAALGPFSELTVRVDELAACPPDVARVLVVENETTYLALPPVPDTIAVFGGGYAVRALAPLAWLHDRKLTYWGDIDTHGFAILDRLRQVFPHTASTLMDADTLLRHRAHWGREATPVAVELARLTPDESQVYRDLVADRYAPALRLEQERIRFSVVEQVLTG